MASQIVMDSLANNIRFQLKIKGWSQSELARRCGWPPARINEILAGKADPRLGTIEKVASAFGLTAREMLMPYVEEMASA
jgi:transcriptional regulator with XRE-family HTH domain